MGSQKVLGVRLSEDDISRRKSWITAVLGQDMGTGVGQDQLMVLRLRLEESNFGRVKVNIGPDNERVHGLNFFVEFVYDFRNSDIYEVFGEREVRRVMNHTGSLRARSPAISVHGIEPPVQFKCRADQRHMSECLRKVS